MAEVSIVIPIYNVEKYLARCIDSVISQTFRDYQIVLVDDGSSDDCPRICDEYRIKDNRIVVIHRRNGGLSAARNSGIEWVLDNNPTKWITFLDSDDWIHPQYLELLLQAANNSGKSIVVSDFCIIDKYSNAYETLSPKYVTYNTTDFFVDNNIHPISACGRLFKTDDFSKIRFPEGRLHEDRFTTYKILFKYDYVVFVKHQLYFCFDNAESLTRTEWNPRRLDDIVAIEEQIRFFRKTHYQKVYKHLLRDYMGLLIYSLKRTKNNTSYKKYEFHLRNKLRKFRLCDAKKIQLNKKDKMELFKYSYPFCFRFYRKLFNK